jgi:hypothetical protein
MYFGMNRSLINGLNIKMPKCISKAIPKHIADTLRPFIWLSFHKGKNYIESGLHFDDYYGFLIQISGTKKILLYEPKDIPNLYITPMLSIDRDFDLKQF